MSNETIFGKIIRGEIPAKKVFEDQDILAFWDIAPQAPTHIIIIPKKYLENLISLKEEDCLLLGKLLLTASKIAKELKLDQNGYRVVINNGANACQTVFHLHLHLLAGRAFSWPPG
jgi:histidine triad (HIT) family protein